MATSDYKPGKQVATSPTAAGSGTVGPGKQTRVEQAAATSNGAVGGVPAWDYIEHHRVLVLGAVRERIAHTGLPDPHPRLRWSSRALATATVASELRSYAEAVPGLTLKRLAKLSYPSDVVDATERARNGRPETAWLPEVGAAVGEALDEPLVASIDRMGMRLRVQLDGDASGVMPRGSSLVASCPLDGVIADSLVSPGVVTQGPARRGASDTPGKPFAHGAVEVEYEWLGARDPALWNWIRVSSPRNATAEHVARTPLAGGEVTEGSEQAYRIIASPPYFAIPFETARRVPAAWQHAPEAVKAGLAHDPGPRVADGAGLATSALADEAAIAQAGPTSKGDLAATRALDRAETQAAFLAERLAPWHAGAELVGVHQFLQRRADQLARDPHAAPRWAPVLASVERVLCAVASELCALCEPLGPITPAVVAALAPLGQVLRSYARAAGLAHLAAQVPASLAEARRQAAMLPIAMLEQQLQIARGAVATQQRERGEPSERADETTAALPKLATGVADLRLQIARGAPVDSDAAADLAVDADETALRAQISLISTQLLAAEHRADEVGLTLVKPDGWTVQRVMRYLRGEAQGWLAQLDRAKDPDRTEGSSRATTSLRARTAGARRTLESVRAQIKQTDDQVGLSDFLKWAYERIADQQLRNTLNTMAMQIGLMIATGEVAGAAVAALRGFAMARELVIAGEVIGDVRKLGLAYTALETVGQAALQTAAQGATGGPSGGRAFAENLAGMTLTGIVLRPFHALVDDAAILEREVQTWAQTARSGAKAAVMLPIEAGAGVVAAGTAHALVTANAPAATGADELIAQGIALAASKLVHRHAQQMRARISRVAAGHDPAELQALLHQLTALEAAAAGDHPTLAQARTQLAAHAGLLAREAALYDAAPADHQARSANAAERAQLTGPFIEASFRLAGLRPVVDGAIYEGSRGQIADAFTQAERAGAKPSRIHQASSRTWTVSSGERIYTLRELPVVLAGDDAALLAAARRARPVAGYVDVVVHASAKSFVVVRDGVELAIDQRALATYLRKQGLAGQAIRLVACNAGASELAIAQDLANQLQVEVLAPNKTAWINAAGDIGVGVRDVNDGAWQSFRPARQPPARRAPREPYREPPELRTPDGSEVDAPIHVEAPIVDNRARVQLADYAPLTAKLGVAVAPAPELGHGVEVRATPRQGLGGYDLTSVEVRVGPEAVMSDVLRHADTVANLRKDNTLLGRLRQLTAQLRGPAPGTGSSRFPPRSRGHVTELELRKLEAMIADRHAQHRDGVIDRQILDDEVQFLEGQLAFHAETLQAMADAGDVVDPSITVQRPDIGAVTREAQAAGYQLPGHGAGVGAHANPEHYYYRRSAVDPSQFELARKPTAPAEAPGYRARVSNGQFVGLSEVAELGAPQEVVPPDWTKAQVVARLRETSFGPYAAMLERHGIASAAVVDAAIATTRGRRNQAGAELTLDSLRRDVKQYFRDRVEAVLLDPRLDATASYRNMQAMVEGLNNADRGALVQRWYTRRSAPTGRTEAKYQVARSSGGNQGKLETRVADVVVDGEIREVKDVTGRIDSDQLAAYAELLGDSQASQQLGASKLRYVFTRSQGALANMDTLGRAMMQRSLKDRFSVEVFDASGRSVIARTPSELRGLALKLKGLQ